MMIGRLILTLCLALSLCSACLAADNSTAGNSTMPIARGLGRVMAVHSAVLTEDSQEMHMSLNYNGSFASAMVFYRYGQGAVRCTRWTMWKTWRVRG